jgi:hypothetical protein
MAGWSAIGDLGARVDGHRAEAATVLLDAFERLRGHPSPEWESSYEGLLNLTEQPMNNRPMPTRSMQHADVDPEVIALARAMV